MITLIRKPLNNSEMSVADFEETIMKQTRGEAARRDTTYKNRQAVRAAEQREAEINAWKNSQEGQQAMAAFNELSKMAGQKATEPKPEQPKPADGAKDK